MRKTVVSGAASLLASLLVSGLAPLPAAAGGGLAIGQYACYGAGGELLIGLGFQVLDGARYNDLDGNTPGTYAIDGGRIIFQGGTLDGETGVDLKDGHFNLASHGISCEPYT